MLNYSPLKSTSTVAEMRPHIKVDEDHPAPHIAKSRKKPGRVLKRYVLLDRHDPDLMLRLALRIAESTTSLTNPSATIPLAFMRMFFWAACFLLAAKYVCEACRPNTPLAMAYVRSETTQCERTAHFTYCSLYIA